MAANPTIETMPGPEAIDRASPLPYYSQLEQILRERIERGELGPGEQLPSEYELVEHYSISRTTARQAITQLCHVGVVERIRGKGTFVVEPPEAARARLGRIGFLECGVISSSAYYALIAKGIESVTGEQANHLVVATTTPQTPRDPLPPMVTDRVVDGVILTGVMRPAFLKALARTGLPHVIIGSMHPDGAAPVAMWDSTGACRHAVEWLAGSGHRRIAMLNGETNLLIHCQYRAGFRQAVEMLGLDADAVQYVEAEGSTKQDGIDTMTRILADGPPPTALICGNDYLAWGAMDAAAAHGLRVPEDIAIMGIGDVDFASLLSPPLTTIRIPLFELGRRAARMLFELLDRGRLEEPAQVIPFDLAVRASTGNS